MEDNGGEEADVDVAGDLKDVFILPVPRSEQSPKREKSNKPFFLLIRQFLTWFILSRLIDAQQILGNLVMVPREHDHNGHHARRHHHNPLARHRVRINQSIRVRPHPMLLFIRIPVQRA